MKLECPTDCKLHSIDVRNPLLQCPLSSLFLGQCAKDLLAGMGSKERSPFLTQLKEAYIVGGKYLQEKLPVQNSVLRALSSLDPILHGHTVSQTEMENLICYFPTVISAEKRGEVIKGIKTFHLATSIPEFPETARLDHWWAQVLPNHPALLPLVQASLSIFTGPRVEQSFSMMNNIITSKSNRMAISTYEAYQAVKYHLQNEKKSSVQLFKRNDILFDPVGKPLLFHMQTAWQRNKSSSLQSRPAAALKKVSAHEKCTQQMAAILGNAKRSREMEGLDGANAPKRPKV